MSPDEQVTLAVDDKGCVVGIGKTPYFVAEDFPYLNHGHAKLVCDQASAKVQPLIEEIERLRGLNAFYKDVFEKQKQAIDDFVNVKLENQALIAEVEATKKHFDSLSLEFHETEKQNQSLRTAMYQLKIYLFCEGDHLAHGMECGRCEHVAMIDLALGKGGGT